MSAAVIVANTLPAQIVALSNESLEQAAGLVEKSAAIVVTHDQCSIDAASAVYREMDALQKAIAKQRLEITRPIDALKTAIMEAERKATNPLSAEVMRLAPLIKKAEEKRDAIKAEEVRKAREWAEAKARAERERLEKERQELIEKQRQERAEAEQLAKDEAAMFGVEAEPLPPVEEPPPVVIVPVVEAPGTFAISAPKSAVRTSTRKRLVIDDAAKIPREIAGAVLLVPDEKAIDKLLRAGVAVPGCRLESYEAIGSAGVR
jgi:hypothetical protein